jgi:hypothetical protein
VDREDHVELDGDDAEFEPEAMDDDDSGANPWAKASSGEVDAPDED